VTTFKDQVASDIQNVFLNSDEFATPHLIDGREIMVIVDENPNDPRSLNMGHQSALEYGGSTSIRTLVIYVDPLELGYEPRVDTHLNFDGKVYNVRHVATEDGLYRITLEAYVG